MAMWSFSYSLSRPYPFRGFTTLVIIEFLLAFVLFSLINYASQGYDLVSEYYSDPNATESRSVIPGVPAFLTSKSQPSCQSTDIAIGTTISTNNSALTYTLSSVRQGGRWSPSLVYHNNPLEDCHLNNVVMNIESIDRTAAQVATFTYGVDVNALVTCAISSEGIGKTAVNLTAQYSYVPPTVGIYDGFTAFAGRNRSAHPSLYWAEVTLSMLWAELVFQFDVWENATKIWGDYSRTKAVLYLNSSRNATEDLTSYNYYEGLSRILNVEDDGGARWRYRNDSFDVAAMATSDDAQFWYPADALAKAFESTVMTDLGQTDYRPNMFAQEDLLEHFTQNFSNTKALADEKVRNGQNLPLPTQNAYNASVTTPESEDTPLLVKPSVVSTSYICQVPRRKPLDDLWLSVLVADLVLLQALWQVTMWIATLFAEQKDSRANWCEGCSGVRMPETPKPQTHWPSPYKHIRSKLSHGSGYTELDDLQSLVSHPDSGLGRSPRKGAREWD